MAGSSFFGDSLLAHRASEASRVPPSVTVAASLQGAGREEARALSFPPPTPACVP